MQFQSCFLISSHIINSLMSLLTTSVLGTYIACIILLLKNMMLMLTGTEVRDGDVAVSALSVSGSHSFNVVWYKVERCQH